MTMFRGCWRIGGIGIAILLVTAMATPVWAAPSPFDAAYAAQGRGDYRAAIRLYSEALESPDLGTVNRARAYMNRGGNRRY